MNEMSPFLADVAAESAGEAGRMMDPDLAFGCLHLGYVDMPIGTLLSGLQDQGAVKPPRSGHLGNWHDIARGHAGALDFNTAICTRGLGYPLIHTLNQTETDDLSLGDRVYLPGSSVEGDERRSLPLFTWDGNAFVERGRDEPYACPLVQTSENDALCPLVEFHWRRMSALPDLQFVSEARVLAERRLELRPMLQHLIECAGQAVNPSRALQALLSGAVSLDGRVRRSELRKTGRDFTFADRTYGGAEEVAESAFDLLAGAVDCRPFLDSLRFAPPSFPMLSTQVISLLSAFVLGGPALPGGDIRLHFHWGARDMAGYPPRRRGYFASRSHLRALDRMAGLMMERFPQFPPLRVVLLPAAIFLLCPPATNEGDMALVRDLIASVLAARAGARACELERMELIATRWAARNNSRLSAYLKGRFIPRSGLGDRPKGLSHGRPAEPEGFRELTTREACAIVGAVAATLCPAP